MDLIVSSRLHLLIFASILGVPIIGVSRGSKVDSFLRPLGLHAAGSTEECDFGWLLNETERLLANRDEFASVCTAHRAALMERLTTAKKCLREVLAS